MYFKRHGEKVVKKCFKWFPSVIVTGARQVGKSTLLQQALPKVKYLTLDDTMIFNALQKDPRGFLEGQGTPIIYDEIQKAGSAFVTLKFLIDQRKKAGMFALSGSQKFALMQNVADSLAGRIGIMELAPLSGRELFGDEFSLPFLPIKKYLKSRKSKINYTEKKLWKHIHRGGYPALWQNKKLDWAKYFESYLRTYLERDVRSLSQVGDLMAFQRFMIILAGRIGGLLNVASVARDADIDVKTAKRWISILEASNIIFLLQPFATNSAKRVIKAPKLYFWDTGLVCYLTKWHTAEAASVGALAGALFENFVVVEIMKSYMNAGEEPSVYYFREAGGREIDLLFYMNNTLYPLEIKKTASPNMKDIKNFELLAEYFPTVNVGEGGVLCTYDQLLNLDKKNWVIPLEWI